MMIGGACIAAFSDLSFDLWGTTTVSVCSSMWPWFTTYFHALGYTLIFINNLLTALNGVVIKSKLNLKESFNSFGTSNSNSQFAYFG